MRNAVSDYVQESKIGLPFNDHRFQREIFDIYEKVRTLIKAIARDLIAV